MFENFGSAAREGDVTASSRPPGDCPEPVTGRVGDRAQPWERHFVLPFVLRTVKSLERR